MNMAANFFNEQPVRRPTQSVPAANNVNILPESNSYFANEANAGMATAQIAGKEPSPTVGRTTEAFPSNKEAVQSSAPEDEIAGPEPSHEKSLELPQKLIADDLSNDQPEAEVKKTMDDANNSPYAEIYGELPKKKSEGLTDKEMEDVRSDLTDDISYSEQAQQRAVLPSLNDVLETASNVPPLDQRDSLTPLNYGTETAKNLPPLNHGMELLPLGDGLATAANLPPLNHGTTAEALPPLAHGLEDASNLPPLNHGTTAEALSSLTHALEAASNLPPLNHGTTAEALPPLAHGLEDASNLPPLNHGTTAEASPSLAHVLEAASNLPPLNHGTTAESLPPLAHGLEAASNLPPLNHGTTAEALPPLAHGLEAASNLPPLMRGVEQEKILQPFSTTGKDFNPGNYGNEGATNMPVENTENYRTYSQPMRTDFTNSNIDAIYSRDNVVSNLKSEISDILDPTRANYSNLNQTQEQSQSLLDNRQPLPGNDQPSLGTGQSFFGNESETNILENTSSKFFPSLLNIDESGLRKSLIDNVPPNTVNESALTDKYGNFIKLVPKSKNVDKYSDEFSDVDESKIFRDNAQSEKHYSRFSKIPNPPIPTKASFSGISSIRLINVSSDAIYTQDGQTENPVEKSNFPEWFRPYDKIQNPPENAELRNRDDFKSQETAGSMVGENAVKKDTWFSPPKFQEFQENATRESTVSKPFGDNLTNPTTGTILSFQPKTTNIPSTKFYSSFDDKERDSLRRLSYHDSLNSKGTLEDTLTNDGIVTGEKKDKFEGTSNSMTPRIASFAEGPLFNQGEQHGGNNSENSHQLSSFNADPVFYNKDIPEVESKPEVNLQKPEVKFLKPEVISTNGSNVAPASFIEGALFNQIDINPLSLKAKQQDTTGNKQQENPPKSVSYTEEENQVDNLGNDFKSQKPLQTNVLGKQQVSIQGSTRDKISSPDTPVFSTLTNPLPLPGQPNTEQTLEATTLSESSPTEDSVTQTPLSYQASNVATSSPVEQDSGTQSSITNDSGIVTQNSNQSDLNPQNDNYVSNTPIETADQSVGRVSFPGTTVSASQYNQPYGQSSYIGPVRAPSLSREPKIGFNSPTSTFHQDAPLKQITSDEYSDYIKPGKHIVVTNQRTNSKYAFEQKEKNHGLRSMVNFPGTTGRAGDQEAGTRRSSGSPGENMKSYRPPMLPPLEHAQSSPEMNFFYSNPADTEGSRFQITADQMKNSYQSTTPSTSNLNFLPPLNHNELPPLKYTYDQSGGTRSNPPPIYPYSIPPEGETQSQGYTGNNIYQNAIQRQMFPEGGNPYPLPLPPEGDQQDQQDQPKQDQPTQDQPTQDQPTQDQPIQDQPTQESGIGKKNLIRPKPDLKCGSGWTGAYGDFGTFCYILSYKPTTWDGARKSCKSAGGDLFSVTNAYEQRFLDNFTSSESWIGYRDKSLAGTWTWSDGSKSVYSDWDSSAKDDHGKGRDCVVLDSSEGKWRDASCSHKHSFLCKKSAIDCSEGWKKLTLNSVRGCYKFNEGKKTWVEAKQACLNDEGSLASILSDDEQTMVSQVYSKHNMWIGYNDKDNEGDWVWTDRMMSSYTNWDDKSPNNGGITCAIVTRTGRWHDEPCQSRYHYICKKPSPKSIKDLQNDGVLIEQVQSFISKSNLVPDIDTSVSIFGRQAVSPRFFWTAQKIYHNKMHGSNPISVHGHIKSVDGGLQLNGVDSWLDAGDFYGQCLGDPDLCIKGFSFAMQLNFDDDAKSYKDKRYVLDSAGDSRGISIYLENNTVHYKVATSTKTWDLTTDLVTNDWQDVVLTWKKEEGLMLYVNGAFRDSQKEGTTTEAVPNKQARLTIGRKSGNPPYRYTRMYMSSLYAFTRFLSPEDIPYVFTYDDTVTARYTWLLPELRDGKVDGSPDIVVHGPVKAVDGGVFIDGAKSYLKVGNFEGRCISDPTKCPHGLSLSYKLKLNRIVRTYKDRRYIMDSGGHVTGNKGIAAYIVNNNLYFTLAMSTPEDTLRWTVRTSIYTVRWQRVVLTWGLKKGLWLYIDGQFRGLTSTPTTIPRDVADDSSEFIIGRRNVGKDYKPAEFSIGSLSIFKRFLNKKAVSKVFGEKKMPYPGLIREVWKDLPGKVISKLKEDPYYPNDPSLVEIIENFDAPFDVDKDYGSRVKGYFVAPETGNYTFYLSGSKAAELWLSKGESQQNMSSMIALHDATGHNQWNKFTAQISKAVRLEAGKYYYITALEKGTESTDSLSAGVRLPSGRFMRPISKETLQWRLSGDPFAGVIRELWQDVPGYKIADLTSNKNFPNNPSSIEVLDKFDAPHNIGDNYGARVRGYFKAPENGKYRFYLAADTTGELWLSTDESESNVRKIVTLNGWTGHNQWLKFPEQKSDRILLLKGRYYYFEVYHKADKLADCASVAAEFPSGHFEGPIKRVHLSWRLPDGITGPGPSSEEEAIPKPAGLYPLNDQFNAKDASGNNDNGILSNVKLVDGPDGTQNGAYEFSGNENSYVEIPKSKALDTKNSITMLANIYPTANGGPIINYKANGWGVHLWQFEGNELFVRFVHRNGVFHKPIGSRVIQKNTWNQVGATYDNTTGVAKLWHNGKMVKSRNIGRIQLMTQYPMRIGARDGDDRRFTGRISCVQIYSQAMDQQQIGNLKQCPVKAAPVEDEVSGSGSGSELSDEDNPDRTGVSISHEAEKYDKDEEADDLIQGSEFVLGARKCDPTPCENSGKCIRDAKRLDGYRCKCSSDFTGRNCQVSKPDAENPVVKRTKIPKAEKKEGSEKYQKNSTSTGVIEQMRGEKKEDVFLLFQKLGCYKDEVARHDIPKKVDLKSVSQEDCVRACALKEEGFSYFGLQNSDQCYCGHNYGKYGRSDDSMCDKRCNGNHDENCGGNSTNMVYFFGLGTNYTVKAYTGEKTDSDSDAKVYITLYGSKGDSGFRKLTAGTFTKKQAVSETMVLPELGELKKVRILHDNSGKHPSWFLNKVTVTDENGKVFNFPCNEWLSETRGGGKTERLLFAANAHQS